jgi:GNAT superfamily N-acetyltransferase
MEELSRLAELAEAEFMYQVETNAPDGMRAALGMAAARIDGGVALAMRHDPSGYWSKALGFGGPVDRGLLTRLIGFYTEQQSSGAVLQFAPGVVPGDWDDIRGEFGLDGGSSWLQLSCPIGEAATSARARRVRIVPVGRQDAVEWAGVVLRSFGMDGALLGPMLAATVDHPRFRPFAAYLGDAVVGGGSLFLHDGAGVLNSTGVLPEYRNLGAQTGLIAARVAVARDEGCRWITAQVAEPDPGTVNPSLENLRRAGLRPLYRRRNWTWRPPATRSARAGSRGGSPR